MTNIPGISFYDFINKLGSGFLLLVPFYGKLNFFCGGEISVVLFTLLCLIAGMILSFVTEVIVSAVGLRNDPRSIMDAKLRVISEIKTLSKGLKADEEILSIDYYTAYYYIWREGCIGNIPILEVYVAFCRNMMIISLYFILLLWVYSDSCFCNSFKFILSLILIGLIPLMWCIGTYVQNKIYYLVWLGYRSLYKDSKTIN